MKNIFELDVYRRSFELSNKIWNSCLTWDYFAKQTVGMQIVRAVDSISANLAEGNNKSSTKDFLRYCYIAKGSLAETGDWIHKISQRKLLREETITEFLNELEIMAKQLNALISSLKKRMEQS